MDWLAEVYREIVGELERTGHDAVLIGGLAVSVYCEPRFTRDVDLLVTVSGDPDAESLIRELSGANYSVVNLVEQESTGRLAAARLVANTEDDVGIVVDLFFASSGIEPEIFAQASVIDVWPGFRGRVARAGHLIALKLLSRAPRRPQDHVDLVNLLLVADAEERALAYEAAGLIEERWFARGKKLCAELDALIKELEL